MAKAPKTPSLADQLTTLQPAHPRVWDYLTQEQRTEIDAMIRQWWEIPAARRPTQRQVAKLVSNYLGRTVNQSTLHSWLHMREPNV